MSFTKGAYSLGKVVWGKGWEELLKLLDYCKTTDSHCPTTAIDAYGDGEARKTVSPRNALLWHVSSCFSYYRAILEYTSSRNLVRIACTNLLFKLIGSAVSTR